MAVMRIVETPGATTGDYDRVGEIMGMDDPPEGLIDHIVASDGTSLTVVDVWESEEALDRFTRERLAPAMAEAGLSGGDGAGPRTLKVHNRLTGAATDAAVLILIEVEDLGADAYDQMAAQMPAHTGDASQGPWVSHTAAHTEGDGIFVADVWESPEAFGKFAEEQIGPAGAAVGMGPVEPRIVPVHRRMAGKAAQPAS
jgi:heme-degrading monooxygenase HmoA